MQDPTNHQWRDIALALQSETNQANFSKLVRELCEALERSYPVRHQSRLNASEN
jgi:hypothetical protein